MLRSLFASITAAFLLTACNTMQGIGKDVERGGERIQDSAQKHK